MDLADLDLFRLVVRLGSISEAARHMRVSQPTASRRIRALEEELGHPLLTRGHGKARPTPAGLALLHFAEEVVGAKERLFAALGTTTKAGGMLRIVASTVPAEEMVPDLVAAFREEEPDWVVELSVLESARVEALVAEGRADVGFTGCRPSDTKVIAYALAEDEIVLAVPEGHWLAAKGSAHVTELAAEPFVERHPGSGTRRTVEAHLRAKNLPYPLGRVVMEVDSTRSLIAAVRHGQGIGFASEGVVARSPGVRAVRLEGLCLGRSLFLLVGRHPTPGALSFLSFVLDRLRPEDGSGDDLPLPRTTPRGDRNARAG